MSRVKGVGLGAGVPTFQIYMGADPYQGSRPDGQNQLDNAQTCLKDYPKLTPRVLSTYMVTKIGLLY